MAEVAPAVLRIPRSDEEGSFVLVRVSPSSTRTSRPLDVKLVATEGVAPYVLQLRHDRVDKLRLKNAPCSADEWERFLSSVLRGQEDLANIDATATVNEEKALEITIRRRVQNITQRLGTLSLVYDGDEGIELFEWCGEAVDGRLRLRHELASAESERNKLEKDVDELRQQLDDFLKAKVEDEKELLAKFCLLLNEKKVKIRIQQQQLAAHAAATKVKEETAEIKEESPSPAPVPPAKKRRTRAQQSRPTALTAGPARRGAKRRAAASPESESGSDDGFEGPAAAKGHSSTGRTARPSSLAEKSSDGSDDDDDDDDRTTENDADSTESEAGEPMVEDDVDVKEEDDGEIVTEVAEMPNKPATDLHSHRAPQEPGPEAPPPRRALAFGRKKTDGSDGDSGKQPAAVAASKRGDSETDSDDEL